jgi:proteasome lid subunit RPN8/RPN11
MQNIIIKKDLTNIINKARKVVRNNGHEICGLLIHNGHFLEILETRNIYTAGGHFQFDANQINKIKIAVKELGHEIVGTFHSHPASIAKPSMGDIDGTVDDSLMLVIDCIGQEAQLWRIKGGKARRVKINIIRI